MALPDQMGRYPGERHESSADSRLRLQTIVRLRWIAVLGQSVAIALVSLGLGFDLPVGPCLVLIAASAWLNVFLSIRFPARHRLSVGFAAGLLGYDILQLAGLLFLTGGIDNPFVVLMVAPVTVSAATLPLATTVGLGLLAAVSTAIIAMASYALPWYHGGALVHSGLYKLGVLAAIISCMTFIAIYAWRLTKESREMSDALAATEFVLAREQKLHALDGLAAAAAHELGTPLSTITVVTSELVKQMPKDDIYHEDIVLLKAQAQRCREILQKLTRQPAEQDPMHANVSVGELLLEAAAPYQDGRVPIIFSARPVPGSGSGRLREPVGIRRPGVIYGLGNILENAVDFAETRVDVEAEWDGANVTVTISDDGPGFRPELIDSIGEPYVTSRPAGSKKGHGTKSSGLGLGFFIAKTLLERSGARLVFENKESPQHGAVIRIGWPRREFEASATQFTPGMDRSGDSLPAA